MDKRHKNPGDLKLKTLTPIVKSVMDYTSNQLLTQIPKYGRPELDELGQQCLGYVELVDLGEKVLRYLEVPKPVGAKDKPFARDV